MGSIDAFSDEEGDKWCIDITKRLQLAEIHFVGVLAFIIMKREVSEVLEFDGDRLIPGQSG